MENILDGLPETPKALPLCSSRTVRSVGLRRRTPRDSSSLSFLATSNAMADAKAASSMMHEQRESFAPMSIEDDASNSDDNSFLMSSADWDLLDAETTKEAVPITNRLPGLDEASYSSVTSAMLTPIAGGLKPLEVENMNSLERRTLLPTEGSLEYQSPSDDSPIEKVAAKGNTSLPKKLFGSNEEQPNLDDSDQRKSPIITYKRRVPTCRNSQMRSEKRLKPSSPLKLFNSPLATLRVSSCSTPLSDKVKPLALVNQSPIVCSMESEEDDSLLLDFCDEIEKTVQKDSSHVGASALKISGKKSVDASSSIRAFGGFSTASGTQIPLSEVAVKTGETLLAMFLSEAIEEIPDEYD